MPPKHQRRSARADRPFGSVRLPLHRASTPPPLSGRNQPVFATAVYHQAEEGRGGRHHLLDLLPFFLPFGPISMICSVGRRTVRSSGDVRQLKVTRPLSRSIMDRIASSPFRCPSGRGRSGLPQYIIPRPPYPRSPAVRTLFPLHQGFYQVRITCSETLSDQILDTCHLLSRCEPLAGRRERRP